MGAEALCRGAQLVLGIEQYGRACEIIQDNWHKVATPEQDFRVLRGDVLKLLLTLAGESFDLVYFDPPYASSLYVPVLRAIALSHLLAPRGEIAVEHDPKQWQSINVEPLHISRQKVYGNTALTFYSLPLNVLDL
jgi:16S rRNA (guanine(966)-N(2))-methyltransferase RsmD